MAKTHKTRKFEIDPDGGSVEIKLIASLGDRPEEDDYLEPTFSHVSNTGNHILKPADKSLSMRCWNIPPMFDERVANEAGHNIKLRLLPAPPPRVKFALAIYVLSRSGHPSVIYADLFVTQDGNQISERFGGGLRPRLEYAANLDVILSHPQEESQM